MDVVETELISFTADIIVSDIFVPVSPSGTGKTFSASTWALFTSNILPPAINIRFITEGVMCVVFERAEDMITSIYVSVIKV